MEDEEIIVESEVIDEKNVNENKKEKDSKNTNFADIVKFAFTKYLSIGLVIVALIFAFLTRFFTACDVYSFAEWLHLITYALIGVSLVLETIKFIKNKEIDFKGSFTFVFALSLLVLSI